MSMKHTMTIAILGLGVLCGVDGCAPSDADRKMIISELKSYESTQQRTAHNIEKAKITVFFSNAQARYSVTTPMDQCIFPPIKIDLKKINGHWIPISETGFNAEWPYQPGQTIPIKMPADSQPVAK